MLGKKIGDIEHCAAVRGVGWHLRGYVAAAYLRGLWGKNTGMFGGIILARKNSAKNKRIFFSRAFKERGHCSKTIHCRA